MAQPFDDPEPSEEPQVGATTGFEFGFGPAERRALHQQRREARREMRGLLREHARNQAGGHRGGFGPGFGPGFGFGFGPGGPLGYRGGPRGRRGRGRRGDVRAAILALLAERPMHGYEMIGEITERSDGLWRPSPGSVYPTLQLLVDEGLIVATETEGSKKLFELTQDGREAAAKTQTPPWEEIAEGVDPNVVKLRTALAQITGALVQASQAATPEQQKRVVDIVNNARREIYGILGESE